jgi:hypothetical protein
MTLEQTIWMEMTAVKPGGSSFQPPFSHDWAVFVEERNLRVLPAMAATPACDDASKPENSSRKLWPELLKALT